MSRIEPGWHHSIDRDADNGTITLAGELDVNGSDELADLLDRLITRAKVSTVQANLEAVTFLDSSTITVHPSPPRCDRCRQVLHH